MNQYNTLNAKLSNSQLIRNPNDERNFPCKLLSTNT